MTGRNQRKVNKNDNSTTSHPARKHIEQQASPVSCTHLIIWMLSQATNSTPMCIQCHLHRHACVCEGQEERQPTVAYIQSFHH